MTDPQSGFEDLMEKLADEIELISALARQRAELTAAAAAEDGRVTVTVNADGAVIETRFAPDIEDLDYDAIARAVTSAAQDAFRAVGRLCQEVMAPVAAQHASMPTLQDLIPGLPDLRARLPQPPHVSMAPPTQRHAADVREPDTSVATKDSW